MIKAFLLNSIILLTIALFHSKAASQTNLIEIDTGESIYAAAWSSDSRLLAIATDTGVRIFDRHLVELSFLPHPLGLVNGVTWRNDSMQLATGSKDGAVKIWNRHLPENTFSLQTTMSVSAPERWIVPVAWSPDGTALALITYWQLPGSNDAFAQIQVRQVSDWDVITAETDPFPFLAPFLVWSPDSATIVGVSHACYNPADCYTGFPTLRICNILSGQTETEIRFYNDPPYSAAWSNIGGLAVSTEELGMYDPTTGSLITKAHPYALNDLPYRVIDWDSTGTRLAAASHEGVFVIHDTVANTILYRATEQGDIRSLDWSPDSSIIALAFRTGTIRLLNVASLLGTNAV
jgi:WD40 repeat protein